MKLSRPSLYVIAAILVVIVAAGVLYGMVGRAVHASADKQAPPPPELAPFALSKDAPLVPLVAFSDASGNRQSLAALKGHYVLLNLWAPWCAPCVKELPALARLRSQAPGMRVVAVDVGRGSASDAKAFLAQHGVHLDTYIDADLALLRAFGAFGLPLTVLIGPDGREIGRASGPAAWDAPQAIAYFQTLSAPQARS